MKKIEVQSKSGLIFDPTKIPIPKHKIYDEVYYVSWDGRDVRKMEVITINYSIVWFDNNYTARFTCNLGYDLDAQDYRTDNASEDDMFISIEEASKESIKRKSVEKIKRIEYLQKSILEAEQSVERYKTALEIAIK